MSTDIFVLTTRLREAVKLLNSITSSKFVIVLAKLLTSVADKKKAFSDEEQEQLVQVLSFENTNEIRTLLAACQFIFEQAVYYQLSDTALDNQLAKIEVGKNARDAFVKCWVEGADKVSNKVNQRSIAPLSLTGSSWRLGLKLGHSSRAFTQETQGIVRLNLKGEDDENESLDIAFNHEQLTDFFQQLQQLQAQLDALR